MNEIDIIKRQQLSWAKKQDIPVDEDQYVINLKDNFFTPLSNNTIRDFKAGSGSEIKDSNIRTKIFATHSSSALVCNVFEYWRSRDKDLLARTIGFKQNIKSLVFEQKLSMGLKGNKPNLDVFLILEYGQAVAIESKFTEWMTEKPKTGLFADSYFENERKRWKEVGLPNCQALVENIVDREVTFKYLKAPQLLKHGLGLANMHSNRSKLLYLYYDLKNDNSRIGNEHKKEIERFSNEVDNELDFCPMTYQDLFKNLSKRKQNIESDYLNYLKERYFSQIK